MTFRPELERPWDAGERVHSIACGIGPAMQLCIIRMFFSAYYGDILCNFMSGAPQLSIQITSCILTVTTSNEDLSCLLTRSRTLMRPAHEKFKRDTASDDSLNVIG
jgi:hypothetical protein